MLHDAEWTLRVRLRKWLCRYDRVPIRRLRDARHLCVEPGLRRDGRPHLPSVSGRQLRADQLRLRSRQMRRRDGVPGATGATVVQQLWAISAALRENDSTIV
jgi:hypothetical protein